MGAALFRFAWRQLDALIPSVGALDPAAYAAGLGLRSCAVYAAALAAPHACRTAKTNGCDPLYDGGSEITSRSIRGKAIPPNVPDLYSVPGCRGFVCQALGHSAGTHLDNGAVLPLGIQPRVKFSGAGEPVNARLTPSARLVQRWRPLSLAHRSGCCRHGRRGL